MPYIVFAVFPDADPCLVRDILSDPLRLGAVTERDIDQPTWVEIFARLYDVDGEPEKEAYESCPWELLMRSSVRCNHSSRGDAPNFTLEPRRIEPERISALFAFTHESPETSNTMTCVIDGITTRVTLPVKGRIRDYKGIATCTDYIDDDEIDKYRGCTGNGCQVCVKAERTAFDDCCCDEIAEQIRAKGLIPARELVDRARNIATTTLADQGTLPRDLSELVVAYYCPRGWESSLDMALGVESKEEEEASLYVSLILRETPALLEHYMEIFRRQAGRRTRLRNAQRVRVNRGLRTGADPLGLLSLVHFADSKLPVCVEYCRAGENENRHEYDIDCDELHDDAVSKFGGWRECPYCAEYPYEA